MKSIPFRLANSRAHEPARIVSGLSGLALATLFGLSIAGCNGLMGANGNTNNAANPGLTYMAAGVEDVVPRAPGIDNLESYIIDHSLNPNSFAVSYYNPTSVTNNNLTPVTILYSGSASRLSNGIFDLNITYPSSNASSPPLTGLWDVEIPGQAALTELEVTGAGGGTTNTSFAPLVPTGSCPNLPTAQGFLFVTIPNQPSGGSSLVSNNWNPAFETAYGSASIATSGPTVQFSKITQNILPGFAPPQGVNAPPSYPDSATGACSTSSFGQTISVPSATTVTISGTSVINSPYAMIGIGPGGFLLEDVEAGLTAGTFTGTPYENVLGAGYGAIGLPRASSAVGTSTVVGAQYQGILYGAHDGSSASLSGPGFRLIGSFGGSSQTTSSCATTGLSATNDGTIIYGGEFANNDPSANTFGNCDLAIDLGPQNASTNGLYDKATVYVSASFPYNKSGGSYSFNAVAIAGQIAGKYAIFLIGMDTGLDATGNLTRPAQPWGIYLLQSN